MKSLITTALLFSAMLCTAQRVIDVSKDEVNLNNYLQTAGSEPPGYTKFVSLKEGTPYFTDRWLKSSIVISDGTTFKNVPAKLNLMQDQIHYLDAKGNEMIMTSPIKEIIIANDTKDSLFRFIPSAGVAPTAKKGWYLWQQTGKASLYVLYDKELLEEKPYGSATVEQRIKTKKSYVIAYNNALFGFYKIKQVPSILANKKGQLEGFIQKQSKDESEEERIVALIGYYNSLLK
ncbi:MAG TPA: hypothetical protein VM888_12920 [Chitinophagaceae bacterium]|nr:hypothetical protein [Chitinophagaceae bacterium]